MKADVLDVIDLSDLTHYRTYHRPALAGREFVLRIMTHRSGAVVFRHTLLVDALKQALSWCHKGEWIELRDFEGKVLVSRVRFARLLRAASGDYGIPSKERPYMVQGPTINPTFMEEYWTVDLLKALDYAVHWQSNCDGPYWAEVRAPNGKLVLPRSVVMELYHASVKAYGGSITVSIIRTTDKFFVGPGFCMQLGEVVESRRIV